MKLLYKYYLMIALPLISCLFIIGTILSFQMYNYSVAEKHDSLELAARRVSNLTQNLYYNHSISRERMLKTVLTSMTNNGDIHIVLCDSQGEIFMTSDTYGTNYMGARISPEILSKARGSDLYTGVGSLNNLYRGKNYTVGVATKDDLEKTIGYVFVTTSISNVQTLMTYVRNLFSLLALIVFVLAAIISALIVKRMARPLNEIAVASSRFARGDFSTRVANSSSDEIGELTHAFNNMADSLEKSEELRRSFVANVSHELRSPMTSIGGFVDGILDETIPKEKQAHYLQIVSDEVHRLSRLVSRMLDITVMQSRDITEQSSLFDFSELINRVSKSFEGRVSEENIKLNIDLSQPRLELFANEDALYQVIYNLLENAVKFSEHGSNINIAASIRGNNLICSVENFGAEIPEGDLLYVFDRFHKADRSRSHDKDGLGLGLYIAKTIINQHGGKISAESADGRTKFSFLVPTNLQKSFTNK